MLRRHWRSRWWRPSTGLREPATGAVLAYAGEGAPTELASSVVELAARLGVEVPVWCWVDTDSTIDGNDQVAETLYTTGRGRKARTVRLVVTDAPDSPTQHRHVCGRIGLTTR